MTHPLALRLPGLVALALVLIVCTPGAFGQKLEPSDVWFRAFLLMKDGEELEAQQDTLGAYNKYVESKQLFDAVARESPEFHPTTVRYRRKELADKITALREQMKGGADSGLIDPSLAGAGPAGVAPTSPGGVALPEWRSQGGASPEFSGPAGADPSTIAQPPAGAMSGAGTAPRNPYTSSPPGGTPSHGLPTTGAVPAPIPAPPAAGSTSSDPLQQATLQIQRKFTEMQAEIDRLNGINQRLERQLGLKEQQLTSYAQQLQLAEQRAQELRNQIEMAENSGSDAEVDQLKDQLRQALDLVKSANRQNRALLQELEIAREEYQALLAERDEIAKHRDQLAAIVDSDAGKKQVEELTQTNERLREELSQARELAERLAEEKGNKEAEISLLKEKVNRIDQERAQLLEENHRHQQHIAELQEHLKTLGKESLIGQPVELAMATPEAANENKLLRGIVLRQLSRQAQLKQAKRALLLQLEELGVESASLLAVIDDIAAGPGLSPEERDLFKEPKFVEMIGGDVELDGRIVVQEGEPGESGEAVFGMKDLEEELDQIQKAARLDYREGRFVDAETGYERYLSFRPRSVEGLCNLALVKVRLDKVDPAIKLLEKAIAYDNENGRPYYLLGVIYFQRDQLDDSLKKIELSLKYLPQNARAHNYIGVISSQKGWVKRATDAFSAATELDPAFADPHFNLAVLYTTGDSRDPDKAEEHYIQALELGADRDAAIETYLKSTRVTETASAG